MKDAGPAKAKPELVFVRIAGKRRVGVMEAGEVYVVPEDDGDLPFWREPAFWIIALMAVYLVGFGLLIAFGPH